MTEPDRPDADLADPIPDSGEPSTEPLLVAVDFTAETLRLLLADLGGEVHVREDHPLPALPGEDAWSWEIGGRIAAAFSTAGRPQFALGIAIACPGGVDPISGRMLDSDGQQEWVGLPVVDAVRRHIDAPIVALERTRAALRGETAQGAAAGVYDVLYVSLRGRPRAALMVSGRIVGGGAHRAGELPALAALDPAASLDADALQMVVEVLADASALLDPSVVVLDGAERHVEPLGPVLQGVLDEIAPGVRVLPAALGEHAALAGALQAATTIAYERAREA